MDAQFRQLDDLFAKMSPSERYAFLRLNKERIETIFKGNKEPWTKTI